MSLFPMRSARMTLFVAAVVLCASASAFAQAAGAPSAAAAPATTAAAAPATTAAAAPVAAPARESVKATLVGNNVRIRKGPGTEYPAYLEAPLGYEVNVFAQQGEWYEIEFPASGYSWISKEFLQKIDEKSGMVIGNNVSIRIGPGTQFDRLYTVPIGHKFQVLGMDIRGEWYRVAPMPGETAWILAQYVRLSGPLPGGAVASGPPPVEAVGPTDAVGATDATGTNIVTIVTPPPTVKPVVSNDVYAAKLMEAEKLFKAEVAKEDPMAWDFTAARDMYTEVSDKSDVAATRLQAKRRLSQLTSYEAITARAKELGKIDDDLQARLNDLEKQRAEELTTISTPAATPFIATGLVEKFYIKNIGGATHKLVDGRTILYLLKSDVISLGSVEGKKCGIRGKIVTIEGFPVRLIEVVAATPLQ